jgi:hypothetical protein
MKPHLLLALSTLLAISCKKDPVASNSTSASETSQTQAPPPTTAPPPAPDSTSVSLWYHISDAEMKKRLGIPPPSSDPFGGPNPKYPSQQLAQAGLPLPKGASITRVYDSFLLLAPTDYHEKVAALLGVKGTTLKENPNDADGDRLTDEDPADHSGSK